MTYVLELTTPITGKTRIGLMRSGGFSCTKEELPNEIFIRARAEFGIKSPWEIISCKEYANRETANLIAESMETENAHYIRKNPVC